MRKKYLVSAVLGLFVVLNSAGEVGKYVDLKRVLNDYITTTETLVESIEKAEGAKEIAKALNSYVEVMLEVMPEMGELEEKYPELDQKLPVELEDVLDQFQETMAKMEGIFEKIIPYAEDGEVLKALEGFQQLE